MNKNFLFFLFILFLSLNVFALTNTDANYSAGIYNGGFELGTGSKTGTGIIGDTNYGWTQAGSGSTTFTSDYNSTIKYSGNQSIRTQAMLSTSAIFTLTANKMYSANPIGKLNNGVNCYNVKPSTQYISSYYAFIEKLDTNLKITIRNIEYSSSFVRVATPSGSDYTTVGSWILVQHKFTTQATTKCVFVEPIISLISGKTGTDLNAVVYFDDVRLEEVSSLELTGQVSGRPSIVVTGVSDFNAIDQADTNNSSTAQAGNATEQSRGQCFTPTQSKFNGIIIQKGGITGTPTSDIIVSLRDENTLKVNTPLDTVLTSKTIPIATWIALSESTDYKIELPYTLDANGTRKYCIDFNAVTLDVNNFIRLRSDTANSYSSGAINVYTSTTGLWTAGASDLYFKTLFEKQSSAFDLNVCSSGDSVCEFKTYDFDGLNNGETYTINPSNAPLFYSGDNNVYFMMHSDSDYNNKTPSMTAKLNYTFDKPTTTFSSFQVPNTTDQNITLTCTDNNTGCKTINYNIKDTNWNLVYIGGTTDLNLISYFKFDETSGTTGNDSLARNNLTHENGVAINQVGIIGKSVLYDGSNDYSIKTNFNDMNGNNQTFSFWVKVNTITTNKTLFGYGGTSGCGTGINIKMLSSTTLQFGEGCTAKTINYTWTNDWTMFTIVLRQTGSDLNTILYINGQDVNYNFASTNFTRTNGTLVVGQNYESGVLGRAINAYIDEMSVWNRSLNNIEILRLYNSGLGKTYPFLNTDINSYSFLYSGVGDHNIQYYSTDNSDNTETTKTSNFTTYGNARFRIKDQNSGLDLNGTQINFNGSDYVSGSNIYDFNLQELTATNTSYLFTISKTGYSTRYYQIDLNYFSSFDINFALLPDTIDVDVPFKVYQTDQTTLFTNTYVEVLDSDTNWTVGRLKTNSTGDATFNLKADDSNYNAIVNNGEFTYTPVAVTVLYPKNEETLAQITEKWKIEITQNLYASYSDLNTSKIIYLLPNTSLPYNIRISDMNGNYFPRTYAKTYPGNPLTDTLQPYLVSEATGLLTTINAISATTNQPLEGITFKVYKYISGLGRTFVEQLTTDSKGQALSLLVLGDSYEFEAYNGSILLKNFPITATSSTIFFVLSLGSEVITQPGNSGFSSKFTPGNIINLETIGSQGFSQTLYNFGDKNITIASTIKQNGANLAAPQNYSGSSDKTFTYTVAWASIVKGNIIQKMVVTTSDGNVYVFDQNIQVIEGFGTGYDPIYGLQYGLRSDLVCSSDPLVPCYPLLVLAFLICVGVTIWATVQFGVYGGQSAGLIFLVGMILFTYLTWIPVWVTAGLVLIILAFIVNERR